MTLRPKKWLLYAPVAALPLLAAWALNARTVQEGLTARAAESLKAAGADWAKLSLDGRDAVVSGDSPDEARAAAALQAVQATYGVRLVINNTRVVPAATPQ